jgi:C-terminal processing protease CtpA/Prc
VAIVKDNELGLIVGEETGGRASCFSEVAPLYLPNSGLLCQIASAKFVRPAGYDDGRGVLPDLPLDLTEKDSVLVEKIYNYIKMK